MGEKHVNILLIIRPELFSIIIMLFLIIYDRYSKVFRDQNRDVFFPFALTCLGHCIMALVTEITVNTPSVSPAVNDVCHVLFFLFSLLYSLLFLDYAVSFILPRGKLRRGILIAGTVICLFCVVFMALSPISYLQGNGTMYSAGTGPTLCFGLGFLFFITADVIMVVFHRNIEKSVLISVLPLSFITLGLLLAQILVPEFLFTAQALTITAVGLFFAIENPVSKLQKQAFVDAYLNVWNRNSYEYDVKHIVAERVRRKEGLIYLIGDINGLKAVNDRLGHREGDRLLDTISKKLIAGLPSAYKVYRIGGDEFAAFFFHADEDAVREEIEAVSRAFADLAVTGDVPVGFAIGHATLQDGETLDDVVTRADAMMYESKRRFYETSGCDRRRG